MEGLSSFGFGGTNAHVTCCSTGRDSDQTASSITFRCDVQFAAMSLCLDQRLLVGWLPVGSSSSESPVRCGRHASFPWRKTSYRCLRRKIADGSTVQYECAIKAVPWLGCEEPCLRVVSRPAQKLDISSRTCSRFVRSMWFSTRSSYQEPGAFMSCPWHGWCLRIHTYLVFRSGLCGACNGGPPCCLHEFVRSCGCRRL